MRESGREEEGEGGREGEEGGSDSVKEKVRRREERYLSSLHLRIKKRARERQRVSGKGEGDYRKRDR